MEKRRVFLRFDKDYSKSEFINANKNYRGYKEDQEVNDWFSEVFDEPCIVIRSEPDRIMDLDTNRLHFTQPQDKAG